MSDTVVQKAKHYSGTKLDDDDDDDDGGLNSEPHPDLCGGSAVTSATGRQDCLQRDLHSIEFHGSLMSHAGIYFYQPPWQTCVDHIILALCFKSNLLTISSVQLYYSAFRAGETLWKNNRSQANSRSWMLYLYSKRQKVIMRSS